MAQVTGSRTGGIDLLAPTTSIGSLLSLSFYAKEAEQIQSSNSGHTKAISYWKSQHKSTVHRQSGICTYLSSLMFPFYLHSQYPMRKCITVLMKKIGACDFGHLI